MIKELEEKVAFLEAEVSAALISSSPKYLWNAPSEETDSGRKDGHFCCFFVFILIGS